ncbi:hypothetical protein PCH_Pc13g06970 [Penicillium rubens Wisconsin 54-1255]|uniref:Uncharacterized protein n=1 Tax=Penicillium rubens (strain ATCC 28089 / DSM 1075 / NRRL 1951 / Wisconsin 54-1255) TaxID=500485 RepID=B6H3N5_PENRW|nr:hypothetical protein PCH_Pc13g06970 [Penicillium rubens Wisconsin 54-1255]
MNLLLPDPFPPPNPAPVAILNSTPGPVVRDVVLPSAEIIAFARGLPHPGKRAVVRVGVVGVAPPSGPFLSCGTSKKRQRRGQRCGLPGRGSLGQIQPSWEGIVFFGSDTLSVMAWG